MHFRRLFSQMSSHQRSYNEAIKCLNSLQTNAATLEAIKKSGGRSNERSLPEMRQYVDRMGYKCSDFNAFNAVHIAGTKGKGSTSAFVESILRHYHASQSPNGGFPFKTGLYTSPHLLEVRERIRINGQPLSQLDFAHYFFECWDKLTATCAGSGTTMPTYFRFLTLMAFHVFLREKVDAAVVEVGIGGAYDATNILEKPAVCGVSSLGFDHQAILGETLPEIAWHKCGIFKEGVPAVSVQQRPDAMQVVQQQAQQRNCQLTVVGDSERQLVAVNVEKLGLRGRHQLENAALAVELARQWLQTLSCPQLAAEFPESFKQGLQSTQWPGRAQIINHPGNRIRCYLDGAHTAESMAVCADWFHDELGPEIMLNHQTITTAEQPLYLIFNCTNGRRPERLLAPLLGFRFKKVFFCTNQPFCSAAAGQLPPLHSIPADLENRMATMASDPLTHQREQKSVWDSMPLSSGQSAIVDSVEAAFDLILSDRDSAPQTDDTMPKVLITGSLHLVGSALTVLQAPII